jgi:hypothetical protein
MQLTMKEGLENKINSLEIAMSKDEKNIQFATYRKPTTDIIPNDSCHPTEQILAAIRYLTNHLLN